MPQIIRTDYACFARWTFSATPYAVGALVSSGGTNYYCIAATTGTCA